MLECRYEASGFAGLSKFKSTEGRLKAWGIRQRNEMLSLKEIHRDSKLYALLVTAISLTEGCNKLKCGNCEHVTAATKQLIHQIRMDISGMVHVSCSPEKWLIPGKSA